MLCCSQDKPSREDKIDMLCVLSGDDVKINQWQGSSFPGYPPNPLAVSGGQSQVHNLQTRSGQHVNFACPPPAVGEGQLQAGCGQHVNFHIITPSLLLAEAGCRLQTPIGQQVNFQVTSITKLLLCFLC